MYNWKVFKWENGSKTEDYTPHLLEPVFLEDRLDETMDSGEIILATMPPITTQGAFPPKTKFRLERYVTGAAEPQRTWDFVVEHDDVEEYTGCPEFTTHRVHLIEPSVIAQGMHVDNIALTYELQDVTLDYKTTYVDDSSAGAVVSPPQGSTTAIRKSDEFTYPLIGLG